MGIGSGLGLRRRIIISLFRAAMGTTAPIRLGCHANEGKI